MVIRFFLAQVFLSLVLSAAAPAEPQQVDKALEAALSVEVPYTVYSISPNPSEQGESFMGYPVLGRAILDGLDTLEIGQAVLRGLREADTDLRQSCFAPRHGIETGEQKLLICYACNSVIAESLDGKKVNYAITDGGHQELAEAVFKSGLGWQSWQPVGDTWRHHSGLAIPVLQGYLAEGTSHSETLSLTGRKETVQLTPTPGSVVLENPEGERETVSTQWLDHEETGSPIWYLTGLSSSYQEEENQLTCVGNAFELERIKKFLGESDKPARYRARIRIRPDSTVTDLKKQLQRLRRDGFKLHDQTLAGAVFKTGSGSRSGLPITVYAGLLETPLGPVLLTAEVPGEQKAPLETLIRALAAQPAKGGVR
jgi:hypothetical protein